MTINIDVHSIPILSVCQPYAHLIVHGPKRIENRTWATKYRGWIGIHASKGKGYLADVEQFQELIGDVSCLKFGAMIGVARLVACVRLLNNRDLEWRTDDPCEEWVIDDPWFEGPVGWVLLEARTIEPIVMAGKPGLFHCGNARRS